MDASSTGARETKIRGIDTVRVRHQDKNSHLKNSRERKRKRWTERGGRQKTRRSKVPTPGNGARLGKCHDLHHRLVSSLDFIFIITCKKFLLVTAPQSRRFENFGLLTAPLLTPSLAPSLSNPHTCSLTDLVWLPIFGTSYPPHTPFPPSANTSAPCRSRSAMLRSFSTCPTSYTVTKLHTISSGQGMPLG
jgi:hypothetical protein